MAEAHVGRLSRRPSIGRKRLDSSTTGRLLKAYDGSSSRHQESNEARRPVLVDSGNLNSSDGDIAPAAAKKSQASKFSDAISAIPVHISRRKPSTSGGAKRKSKLATKENGFYVQTPGRVLRDIEPTDVSESVPAIKKLFTRLPAGVVDIDENVGDLFSCPEYAEDIIFNEQCKEERWVLPTDFLEDHNPEITPHTRSVLVDWLISVQDHLQLFVKTLQTGVALLDKVLSKRHIKLKELQLLGITCLFIATKYHEYSSPKISSLVYLTDNTYTAKQVIAMERKVLKIAEFDISAPIPMFFLDRLYMVHNHNDYIMCMAKFILDATLISIHQVQFSSSMRAASALFIARKLFNCEESWTPGLTYYSKYSEKDLLRCFELMVRVLVKAPQSELQGARSKYYSNPELRNISRHPYLAKLGDWQGSSEF